MEIPSVADLREELERVRYAERFRQVLRSTVFTLVVVAAFAVLVATLWMPVLRIYGVSMAPTLDDGHIVVSVKESEFKPGDIVAFYYNNKILVKRAIAQAGEWVDIDERGNVYVNNRILDEPYLTEKAYGDCKHRSRLRRGGADRRQARFQGLAAEGDRAAERQIRDEYFRTERKGG